MTSVFTGRGILSESTGPVWLIGTGESIVPLCFPNSDNGPAIACESLQVYWSFRCRINDTRTSGARGSLSV